MKAILHAILKGLAYALVYPFVWAYVQLERFDRKFWKRYFNIETPVYKWWWKRHAARIQKRIYIQHPEFKVDAYAESDC